MSGGSQDEARAIVRHVEAVAAAFKIPRGAMRLPAEKRGGSGLPEVHLQVGPEFSSYEFHSALLGAVADLGATVVGTEHVREKNTALQILKDGMPLMLVILDMRAGVQQPRKESTH
jgi:hypothetical protein